MSDLVVNEYTDLVWALNAKTGKGPITLSRSNSTTSTLVTEEDLTSNVNLMSPPDSLLQGKFGLQRLLAEFSGKTEKLQTKIFRLHAEVETAEAKCEAERKVSEHKRTI
ncbi:hypothetical protein BDZ94DRAFT_397265 [Collybia nuda]|uniref:Uncharacterized protein n=1 Tax=Collybia nuda TaxID=64659 RepID=A0A9P6CCT7_9AGAR|nr:hypothetical protein BDZ94DRAFT_397265 [Collybia nuda]